MLHTTRRNGTFSQFTIHIYCFSQLSADGWHPEHFTNSLFLLLQGNRLNLSTSPLKRLYFHALLNSVLYWAVMLASCSVLWWFIKQAVRCYFLLCSSALCASIQTLSASQRFEVYLWAVIMCPVFGLKATFAFFILGKDGDVDEGWMLIEGIKECVLTDLSFHTLSCFSLWIVRALDSRSH